MLKRLLKVEVADTPSQHERGLMFRKRLGENDGMMFKFNHPQELRFWGVNTYIPLSIAFVSSDGEIKKIDYISPCSDKAVVSDSDCDMAIEANYDFFQNNKIGVGNKINLIEDKDGIFIKFE